METIFKLSSYLQTPKKKERFETILEPLQALIQLSLLSFCPIGSKLSISNNILIIQSPTWNQSFIRIYNSDTKDDIFFLFSVIKRYNKFYSHMQKITGEHKELFNKLITLSIKGIDNLIQTYSNTGQQHLLHTLRIYKNMLSTPEIFNNINNISNDKSNDKSNLSMFTPDSSADNNIDEIFINITKIYTPTHINLINQIFNLILEDSSNYHTYIKAINIILYPVNEKIKIWINENIIF